MTTPLLYVPYDFASSPAIKTPKARADYLIGRCDEYLRAHPTVKGVTVFLSPVLVDVARVLDANTPPHVTVEVSEKFRRLEAGIQGEML
jgi:hypothetical protein